jgi:cold shock CspA family protein
VTRLIGVQATVHRFDEASGTGSVITDDGLVLRFDLPAFLRSGLRRLRTGQRLSVERDGDTVAEMWLGTVPRRDQPRS